MTYQSPLLGQRFLELISANLNKHWKNLADFNQRVADFSAHDGSEPKWAIVMKLLKVCVLNRSSRNEMNSCHTRSIAQARDKLGHAAMRFW
jgi:hypothetical protein